MQKTRVLAISLLVLAAALTAAVAQQQYDPGGKARVSNYCTTATPGDTQCPTGASGANVTETHAAPGSDATKAEAVQGITGGKPVAISATSFPLPTGAATAANQSAGTAGTPSAVVQTVQGVAGGTAQNVNPNSVVDNVTGTASISASGAAMLTGAAPFGGTTFNTQGYSNADIYFTALGGGAAAFTVRCSGDGTGFKNVPFAINSGSATAPATGTFTPTIGNTGMIIHVSNLSGICQLVTTTYDSGTYAANMVLKAFVQPPAISLVSLGQLNGGTIATGAGVSNGQTQRVTVASDSTIGVEGADGSTQASNTNPLPTNVDGVTDGVIGTSAALGSATQFAFASGLPVQGGSSNQNIVTTGYGSFTFQITSNPSGNTVVVEGSWDAGTTWTLFSFRNLLGQGSSSAAAASSSTTPTAFQTVGVAPLMRVRMSVFAGTTTTIAASLKRSTPPNVVDAFVGNTVATTTTVQPSTTAASGVAPITASTALVSNAVMCAAACNAFGGFVVNTDTAPIWVMAFNATSKPADGAITTAQWFWQVPASSTLNYNLGYGDIPTNWTTGLTLVCSSTGPLTLTADAKCLFGGAKK